MIENNIFLMLEIIAGTPFWAWILFCYIIFKGLKATQNHVIFISKIFIIPTILIGIIFLENNSNFTLYLLFLTIGIVIGILLSFKIPITILKELKAIEVPGTYSKLIILLIFFCVKYSFGYMKATNPDLVLQYSSLETITTALISGYFLGMAIYYSYRFYKVIGTNI